MRVSVSVFEKYAILCLRIYTYLAHTAFCVFIQYGCELRMRVVKTFEHRQQSADDSLHIFCIFEHENLQLPWVSETQILTFLLV